jgi:hypothetical protein
MYLYIVAVHGLSYDYLKGKEFGSNKNEGGTWVSNAANHYTDSKQLPPHMAPCFKGRRYGLVALQSSVGKNKCWINSSKN